MDIVHNYIKAVMTKIFELHDNIDLEIYELTGMTKPIDMAILVADRICKNISTQQHDELREYAHKFIDLSVSYYDLRNSSKNGDVAYDRLREHIIESYFKLVDIVNVNK